MNTTDRFDELVTERLRDAAPREAPDHLLEATMNRIQDTPQRRRGWLGSTGARVLLAAAVVVLAVAVGAQLAGLVGRPVGVEPSPSAETAVPTASAEPTASREPTPVPTVDPEAELPALVPGEYEEPGELALRLSVVCDVVPPVVPPRVTVLEDGRVVWSHFDPDRPERSGWRVRQLSPEGLDMVMGAALGTGYLDESATYRPVAQPGAEPPGHGACEYTYTVPGDGADAVVVNSTMWFGEPEESTYWQPAPERRALHDLATSLQDPEGWLPADAWDGPTRRYAAPSYILATRPMEGLPAQGSPDVADVTWSLPGVPDTFGQPIPGGVPELRCAEIDGADAADLVDQLTALGIDARLDADTYTALAWAAGNGSTELFLVPRAPDGYLACEDLSQEPPPA